VTLAMPLLVVIHVIIATVDLTKKKNEVSIASSV